MIFLSVAALLCAVFLFRFVTFCIVQTNINRRDTYLHYPYGSRGIKNGSLNYLLEKPRQRPPRFGPDEKHSIMLVLPLLLFFAVLFV